MATRRDVRRYGDSTTSTFPKAGDDEAQVASVSGDPSPNTQAVRRPRTASVTPPGGPAGRRTQVEIDATTGQEYGEATQARARETWAAAVGQIGDPASRAHLSNLLGLDAGLDRA
jgi:hypothetical protein